MNMPPVQEARVTQREREQIESDLYQADWVMDGDPDLDDDAWDAYVRFRPEPLKVGFLEGSRLR